MAIVARDGVADEWVGNLIDRAGLLVTGTVEGIVHDVDPKATRGELARDLKRARGRIVALVAIVDEQRATIKDLRDEVVRLKRLAHSLS